MNYNILLIEDSKEVYQMVSQSISSITQDLQWAENVAEATDILEKKQFDLILLDIELPDGNGFELCTQIRLKLPQIPIFFLTSHDNLSEKVLGFSAGADDYITKPFQSLELKARVEAKLSRIEVQMRTADILEWKEVIISKSSQDVKVLDAGKFDSIELTALEFKILIYFANRPNHVIARDKMLDDIWGEDVHVYSRSVDTHVSKLRRKLGPVSQIIESVHGSGYKFCPTTK